jgi:hypothetical protein
LLIFFGFFVEVMVFNDPALPSQSCFTLDGGGGWLFCFIVDPDLILYRFLPNLAGGTGAQSANAAASSTKTPLEEDKKKDNIREKLLDSSGAGAGQE